MLEANHPERLAELLQQLPHAVAIPPEWSDFFEERGILPTLHDEHRQFARKCLRAEAACEVIPSLPAIDRQHGFHRIYLRDISRNGISFLHGEQLFPNERVVLWTAAAKLKAIVCRCVRRCENGYEIGARFA